MFITLQHLINKQNQRQIDHYLAQAKFIDGKLSAGKQAKLVKNNVEIDNQSKEVLAFKQALLQTISTHPNFQQAVFANKYSEPIIAQYTKHMAYGKHIDDPIMGQAVKFRTDIAYTLFLSAPEAYDGGELVITTSLGEKKYKLNAGDLVLYPATCLHEVLPVKQGKRIVMVGWVQSMIRDAQQREILYHLNDAREQLIKEAANTKITHQIDNTYVNLIRMWAEV